MWLWIKYSNIQFHTSNIHAQSTTDVKEKYQKLYMRCRLEDNLNDVFA